MHLEETPEQLALRAELRAYFADLLTDEVRRALDSETEGGAMHRTLVRQMGKDGWLGIGWPEEFGGQGRPVSDQFIFFNEVQRARAPFPFVTLNTVGPMLMRYGTEEQKSFFLSGILAGEINCAIGYTEPGAGTDLASLRTRAVLDGDEWIINGNKIFTSGADQADYIWLAARTDPDAPKHKGISIFLVPTTDPGFSCTPIVTVGGVVTTASYYDNVRVPRTALVGELNEGWRLITGQLNHERVGLGAMSALAHRLWAETAAVGHRRGGGRRGLGPGRPGPDLRPARGPEAAQLADGGGRGRRHAGPGRLLGGQGVRHRDDRSRSTAACSASWAPPATSTPTTPGRRSGATSSGPAGSPRSTPSAAGSTRSSARSWPWPVWA